MKLEFRLVWIAVFALLGTLAASGNGGFGPQARAQESRSSSREGESRDDRRERWRRYGERGEGSSDRGRDGRGRGGDDARRDSGSSSSGSTNGSAASSHSTSSGSSNATPSAADAKPAPPSTPTSSMSSSGSMNMSEYAKGLVKMYDKNGDMMLQPEERKELKGRAAEADLNKDGTITIDELVAHLSSNAPAPVAGSSSTGSASSPAASSSNSSSSSSSKSGDAASKADAEMAKRIFVGAAGGKAANTKEGDKRKSYRFSTAADRLPSNLPSWFKSKDKNGNGQVEMSEYSSSWSKSTADEFRRYDKNDDGVVTPKEAAGK